jgi:glycosyltransferase involved in cell wall biosynthesis
MLGACRHHGAVPEPMRVAYTLEQCWHPVPGGTAVAALRVLELLVTDPRIDVRAVAGRHRRQPHPDVRPVVPVAELPVARPFLYESWLRWQWPLVESATGPVDVCHATGLVPAATRAPLVVTVHDLAFVHTPERFSRQGSRVMRMSLERIRRGAARVICPSKATMDDLERAGIASDRLRLVPLGVDSTPATAADVARVRATMALPEEFVLFVGTVEPRKNLHRLVQAMSLVDPSLPLLVAGVDGWGDLTGGLANRSQVRYLGYVPGADLPALVAAAGVFAYPSEWEGFGLPVAEAMAQGTPVVTSRGTATEEVAGGAAVLVDPFDVSDIARGIADARRDASDLADRGRRRVGALTWDLTAAATVAVYREAHEEARRGTHRGVVG